MKPHMLLYPLPCVLALAACSSMTSNLQPSSATHKDLNLGYGGTSYHLLIHRYPIAERDGRLVA